VSRSSEIVGDSAVAVKERGPAWARLLRAAERGDDAETRRLAVELAHQVLASPAIRLAHEVLAGGPHATARAIELAETFLESSGTPVSVLPMAGADR
jgi:hypothetical protein